MKFTNQGIGWTGGVNLIKDPRTIRPDQLALSKNAWPVIPGILCKRNGIRGIRTAIVAGGRRFIPLTWALAPPITGYKFVGHFHQWDSNPPTPQHLLIASSLDKETTAFANSKTISLGNFQTEYEPVRFINYRGTCLAIVPGMEGFYVLGPVYLKGKPTPGYTWTKATFLFDPQAVAIQNSQAVPITPRVGTQYKQRMVWGNFGPGMGNWLVWADIATTTPITLPTTYPLAAIVGTDALSYNGRHVEVGMLEGEEIVAMQEVTLASMGAQIDSFLLLLTNRSAVLISGDIAQTVDTGATDPVNGLFHGPGGVYQENRINYECGCVSADTLVKTPYGWIWASANDVWFMNDNTPDRIGTNIRPALLACPTNSRKYWSAAYANGIYMLQLVTQQNVTEAGAAAGGITTYLHQYWLLDLRDGAPPSPEAAKWYGPMEVLNEDGNALVFGPLQSVHETDGTERIMSLALYTGNNFTVLVDMLGEQGISHDILQDGITSANEWVAGEQYSIGDVVRPIMGSGSAGKFGRIFVCVSIGAAPHRSGGSEPVWATDGVSPVIDNDLVWEEITSPDVSDIGLFLKQRQDCEFQADIRSRDSMLEDTTHEKLLRRVDANISVTNKVKMSCKAIINNGPITRDLGDLVYGAAPPESGMAEIPFTIGGLKANTRTFRPAETQLVQGRHLQVKLQDKTSYIIDDTNDYFNIVNFLSDPGIQWNDTSARVQVQLDHGEYATIDDLIDNLVSKLNAIWPSVSAAWGTFGANPWSKTSAYAGSNPYMTRINLAYTGLGSNAIGSILSDSDYAISTWQTGSGTTLYASRCKRLLSMLGFEVTKKTYDGDPFNISDPLGITDLTVMLAYVIPSPIVLDGISITQKKNSQRFEVAQMVSVVQPKTSTPLVGTDRS